MNALIIITMLCCLLFVAILQRLKAMVDGARRKLSNSSTMDSDWVERKRTDILVLPLIRFTPSNYKPIKTSYTLSVFLPLA